jgi:hypothetical protein
LPDGLGVGRQGRNVIQCEFDGAIFDQKEPVPAPGHISSDKALTGNVNRNVLVKAIAFNVHHGHGVGVLEIHFHDANRCLKLMPAGFNPAHVRECHREANGCVTAHAKVLQVIEIDHRCGVIRLARGQQ